MNEIKHHGKCLCGSVQYDVIGTPEIVAHCHCEDCQRASGAGHSTAAMYAVENFTMTGETRSYERVAENGNRVTRVFCPVCSSPLYGCNSANPNFLSIALGTLDDSSAFNPQAIIFQRNHKTWDLMDETLQGFDTQPQWSPEQDT